MMMFFRRLLWLLFGPKLEPNRFFVFSVEPFETGMVVHGPLDCHSADMVVDIDGGCGSVVELYEDIGEGVLVPV